jgi:hypothetical protein
VVSIYQSIEMLSKEKGIDPQIVLDAVKDAMLAAARKHFRSQEDLVADLDESSGNIQIFLRAEMLARRRQHGILHRVQHDLRIDALFFAQHFNRLIDRNHVKYLVNL